MEIIDENVELQEEKNTQFYTYRGIAKSLSAAISFVTDRFLFIVKASLPYTLAYTILSTLIFFLCSDAYTYHAFLTWILSHKLAFNGVTISVVIAIMILLAVQILFVGFIMRLTHIHSKGLEVETKQLVPLWRSSLRYAGRYAVFYIALAVICPIAALICFVPLIIPTEGTLLGVAKIALFMILIIAYFVALIPVPMTIPSLFLEKKKTLQAVIYGYKKGWKMWNKLFGMTLLLFIVRMLAVTILVCPGIVMIAARFSASDSAMQGDVIQIPSHFELLFVVILLITQYLMTFLTWLDCMSYNYLYAAMKSDEREQAVTFNSSLLTPHS